MAIAECVWHYLKLSQQLISCFLPFSWQQYYFSTTWTEKNILFFDEMLKWSWIWSSNWQNCKIYPSLCFKFMIRSLNVPIVHLNAQWNLNLFLVDILRYQITIDAQLKFPPVSYEELLKYYFSSWKVHLIPYLKGASRIKR